MRLRHKTGAKDQLQQYPHIFVPDPASYQGKWSQYFGTSRPIHVEIGTGKGRFITRMAEQYPQACFVGLELAESVLISALDHVRKEEVGNVKLLNRDARELPLFFADNEVSCIYLNFSDPWPKNRHEKRRLTYRDFLRLYEKVLKPGGELYIKTDNRNFFKYSLASVRAYGATIENVSRNLYQFGEQDDMVMSEYERKFVAKGYPIYWLKARFE